MKIVILHNLYQRAGGEDNVVKAEAEILRKAGANVHVELVSNVAIDSVHAKFTSFIKAPYDPARRDWAAELVRKHEADLVHVHNFFPLLTPAVHDGASSGGAAVVQTLHNYRLICANGLLLRDGTVCEKCLGSSMPWGVIHRCYRGSAVGSLAVQRMQWRAKRMGTWTSVDRFIALSTFAKAKFAEAGLPATRIVVKPNFYEMRSRESVLRRGALFVGRLANEKGLRTLMSAWRELPDIPLTIVGDGPLREELDRIAPKNVQLIGPLSSTEVETEMMRAALLVFPSIWYEGFPMTILEAFASDLPVLASRLGSLSEIIQDGQTGFLFQTGDAGDLANAVRRLIGDPSKMAAAAENAKKTMKTLYSPEENVRELLQIYDDALRHKSTRQHVVSDLDP